MDKKEARAAAAKQHDANVEDSKEGLLEHLLELRKTVVHIVIAVLIGVVAAFYFLTTPLMNFILEPIQTRGIQVIYTALSEAFTTQIRVAIVAGVVIVSPYVVWQIWCYIKPALYDHEIRLFRRLFFLALILFLLGIFFCYNYVYGLAINFFMVSGEGLATPMLSIDKYVSFLFSFLLPFGIVFELPIAVFMLSKKGLVTYRQLCSWRKYIFFGIFILAAVLTPPDVISQVMLGLPMYALFEIGVQVSRFTKPSSAETADEKKEA